MTEPTPSPPRIAVLLVEDHGATQLLTQKVLERLGCDVETVGTGKAVAEVLCTRTYDIMFLDCILPDMNGLEVARAIRGLGGKYATIPIIGVTADVICMGRGQCLAAGMTDWFSKPAPLKAYQDALTRWVRPKS